MKIGSREIREGREMEENKVSFEKAGRDPAVIIESTGEREEDGRSPREKSCCLWQRLFSSPCPG